MPARGREAALSRIDQPGRKPDGHPWSWTRGTTPDLSLPGGPAGPGRVGPTHCGGDVIAVRLDRPLLTLDWVAPAGLHDLFGLAVAMTEAAETILYGVAERYME